MRYKNLNHKFPCSSSPYIQNRPNRVCEFCLVNILTSSKWCTTYILGGINYLTISNIKYVYIPRLTKKKYCILFLFSEVWHHWYYWYATALTCDGTEVWQHWRVTALRCNSTEVWQHWCLTALRCDSTDSTEVWQHWGVTALRCDSTVVWQHWGVTVP